MREWHGSAASLLCLAIAKSSFPRIILFILYKLLFSISLLQTHCHNQYMYILY
uniref:Uncharacterized protein n=1 Tax=Anguilla anguilla TaxID=7936 RepID=A0A0E9Y2Q7_ANGAN